MITPETIQKIESVFGFSLYDWQKDYLIGKIKHRVGGRHNGNTFAYCVKLLLSDGDPIKIKDIQKYIDEVIGDKFNSIIDERIDKKIIGATDEDIRSLFV